MYSNPADDSQKFYNMQLYHKCLIAVEMPLHKRITKEKLRMSYDLNEMLDHVYDLFLHIAKDLAPVQFASISKGCSKTIGKFSKKLKEMIKTKGDFYFPKSREVSPNAGVNIAIRENHVESQYEDTDLHDSVEVIEVNKPHENNIVSE